MSLIPRLSGSAVMYGGSVKEGGGGGVYFRKQCLGNNCETFGFTRQDEVWSEFALKTYGVKASGLLPVGSTALS